MRDPTRRFADRVSDYLRSRPDYPRELLRVLRSECGLQPGHDVADVGSGTGKLSRLLLDYGNRVFAIEPNREMREAGERLLGACPGFVSIDGRAERTGLAAASVDLVAAGQAFHWFDPVAARSEFLRILLPGRPVVLVWNDRHVEASPFMRAYEQLLRDHGTDYAQVHERRHGESEIEKFYGAAGFGRRILENRQVFDRTALQSRLRSSSYVPASGDPGHAELMRELDRLFDRFQRHGRVVFEYQTRVYFGRPARAGAA